ncbi:MAG: hypothetical protein GY925_25210, partial [Actinomycetia bacterium]|nr:hypothetical protein [Actinomycetes bacterium]
VLAERLPESLAVELGSIAALCREGLMALSVEAGLAAAAAIMAEEADALCGPWNSRDPEREHRRGGTTASSVVMAANVSQSGVPAFMLSTVTGTRPVMWRWSPSACSPRATC